MRILITGAHGQLGRALARVLADHELALTDRASLDVTDYAAVRDAVASLRPDWIVNCAAFTDVDAAEERPQEAHAVNARAPEYLAAAARSTGAGIVHVSTDYVFDGRGRRPYVETDPVNPLSVYGRTKLEGERAVASANPRHAIVRTAWLYSVWGRNFPSTIARKAREASVRVECLQRGSPTYAPDLARVLARWLGKGPQGLIHLAGWGEATRLDLTRRLFDLLGATAHVEPAPPSAFPQKAPRPEYSVLGSAHPSGLRLPDWTDGLRRFVADLQSAEGVA